MGGAEIGLYTPAADLYWWCGVFSNIKHNVPKNRETSAVISKQFSQEERAHKTNCVRMSFEQNLGLNDNVNDVIYTVNKDNWEQS
jgi:hypothetical protein